MDQTAFVLHDDAEEVRQVERLLTQFRLTTRRCNKVGELERHLASCRECLVLLNLETEGVDNALLGRMGRVCPDIHIIGISRRSYHPELEQALRTNLRAVVTRPLDEDELNLCLRGVMNV
ncbi:hypothetical protein [Desulfonatronum thiodismutans]|uniref:hypothetical protein n=1 Tax=Desulfonatronum thiodismutans TaxID=159290 RepID=UPI0004ABE2A9|nr:hypothetical protein [Desulfonatronum thiodismutans]